MPKVQNQTIRPAAPAPPLAELLALTEARQFPLTSEETLPTVLPIGCKELIASIHGTLAVAFPLGEGNIPSGGIALLSAPGKYHLSADGESLCAVVRLTGELPDRILSPDASFTSYSQGAAVIREAVTTLCVLEREGPGIDAPTASACAYTMLMKLLRLQAAGSPSGYSLLIETAIGIIDEEFAYLEGLDDLAQRLEVSKPHLIRTFTREVGISPGKYITRARITYAKLLLSEPDMSIAFAAEAAGFAGSNYFAKVFRRETGLSPTEFQQSVPRLQHPAKKLRDEDRLYMP